MLLALSTTGALELFGPVRPAPAVPGTALLAAALRARLRGEATCPVPIDG